ncbi:MAG: hypothetical protein ABIS45_07180 [Burkholderiales bacterium]
MSGITTRQLAELLIGVARSQQAIIDAVEGMKAGFKGTHLGPALDTAAKLRSTGRPLTLQEFPARILVQCQGRAGPNLEQMIKDLDDLLAGKIVTPSAVAPATARAAAAVPAKPATAAPAAPVAAAPRPATAAPASPAAAAPARAAPTAAAPVPPRSAAPAPAAAPPAAPADNDLDMT